MMNRHLVATSADTAPLTPVQGASVWYGPDLAASPSWIYTLTDDEIAEIDAAIHEVERRGMEIPEITRADFPLASLAGTLTNIRNDVLHGRGLALIRGLPIERYSLRQSALAFWGLGAYFGWAVSQNAKGHVLGHVKDIGHDPTDPEVRIYATNARQQYHTDSCDVVGLLCLRPAKRGGLSSVSSSPTIHNEMLGLRPDLVRVLAQPFYVDRKGEVPAGKGPYYRLAVFHYYAGHLTTIYARSFIEAAQRFAEVPCLTPEQIEAMDMLDALADDPRIRLDMMLEPGDMQFLHNHQTLHARTAYEDSAEPERKRHLLRLWLAPAQGRPLPPVFAERYGSIDTGKPRGGILVPGATLTAPLDAR